MSTVSDTEMKVSNPEKETNIKNIEVENSENPASEEVKTNEKVEIKVEESPVESATPPSNDNIKQETNETKDKVDITIKQEATNLTNESNKGNNDLTSNPLELEQKIIRQVEYYFGNINLPRDKFLLEEINKDDGWVPLEVMLKFKRLLELTSSQKLIAAALEKSENKLVLVSEDKTKIRRNPDKPLPEKQMEFIKSLQIKTVYAKGFPKEEKLNDIMTFLEPYGKVESVIRRTGKDRTYKESCFIVFADIDAASKFVSMENVKYKDINIIRKMQLDYYFEKRSKTQNRKKLNRQKKEEILKQVAAKLDLPSGAILHFTGLPAEHTLSREDIRDSILKASSMNIVFIEFQKGDAAGYIRFAKENNAKDFVSSLNSDEFEIGDIKFKVQALEGEEEKQYLQKTSADIAKLRQKSKNRKRKGGNFGHHKNFKRGKHL